MSQLKIKFSILICLLVFSTAFHAQTNLLLNPNADSSTEGWGAYGDATVEKADGNNIFVVRNQATFRQDVKLKPSDIGKFALLIGRGSSERVNADGAITGLPYLYGYMLSKHHTKGGVIVEYLHGQQMAARPKFQDEWVLMFGIFRIPANTVAIRFFLNQAARKNVPQNGSAARFDDLGLYLFKTKEKAISFAESYEQL